MAIEVRQILPGDDLEQLAVQINNAQWDAANEIDEGSYSAASIKTFVSFERSVFVAAFVGGELAGIASGTLQTHPHSAGTWLYIDEVDVAVNFRRQGVAQSMMAFLTEYAKAHGCYELALGTEINNEGAQKLYHSLKPSYTEDCVWFGYELQ